MCGGGREGAPLHTPFEAHIPRQYAAPASIPGPGGRAGGCPRFQASAKFWAASNAACFANRGCAGGHQAHLTADGCMAPWSAPQHDHGASVYHRHVWSERRAARPSRGTVSLECAGSPRVRQRSGHRWACCRSRRPPRSKTGLWGVTVRRRASPISATGQVTVS
jgi:hypothetical protein